MVSVSASASGETEKETAESAVVSGRGERGAEGVDEETLCICCGSGWRGGRDASFLTAGDGAAPAFCARLEFRDSCARAGGREEKEEAEGGKGAGGMEEESTPFGAEGWEDCGEIGWCGCAC